MNVLVTQRFDPRVLDFVWKHPRVYEAMGDDFLPPAEQVSLASLVGQPGLEMFVAYCENFPIGAISFRRTASCVSYEIHCGFVPEARGKLTKDAIAASLEGMFFSGAVKITAQLARSQRAALRLAGALGFVREGVNRLSVIRAGALVDQIYLGLTKDEWYRGRAVWQ